MLPVAASPARGHVRARSGAAPTANHVPQAFAMGDNEAAKGLLTPFDATAAPARPAPAEPSRTRRLADDLSDEDAAPAPKRATRPPWNSDEEERLRTLVGELGGEKWKTIAERLGTGRSGHAVEQKWAKLKAKNAAAPPSPQEVVAPPPAAPPAPAPAVAAPPPAVRPQTVALRRVVSKAIEMRRVGDASWRRFGTQTDAAKAFGLYQSEVSQIVKDRSKASGRALLYEARRVAAVPEAAAPKAAAPKAAAPKAPPKRRGAVKLDKGALEARMAADGWTKEEKPRPGTTHVDKYFVPPGGGKKLRSVLEVARAAYPEFLAGGEAAAPPSSPRPRTTSSSTRTTS